MGYTLGNSAVGRIRVLGVALWACVFLLVVEVAVQVRSYLLTGQAVFTAWVRPPDYVDDPDSGLRLLRPNAVREGKQQEIRSNGLGLRSDEIAKIKPKDEFRIAVIGASTIMGAYAKSNAHTIPAYLAVELGRSRPGRKLNVINAGIVGYGISEELKLSRYLLDRTSPDLLIIYPGTNDFSGYCRRSNVRAESSHTQSFLPPIELPKWLMSVDLLRKNTVALRTGMQRRAEEIDPVAVDIGPFRAGLEQMVELARGKRVRVVLATLVRAYLPSQPKALQEQLSRSARHYSPCFDVSGLHTLYDRHNELIRQVGTNLGVEVIPLDMLMPGGKAYFEDATHPNDAGNQLVARLMAERLANLLPRPVEN